MIAVVLTTVVIPMIVIRGGATQEIVIVLRVIIDEVVQIMDIAPTEIARVVNVLRKRKVLVIQPRSAKNLLLIQILGITVTVIATRIVIAIMIPSLINVLFSYC